MPAVIRTIRDALIDGLEGVGGRFQGIHNRVHWPRAAPWNSEFTLRFSNNWSASMLTRHLRELPNSTALVDPEIFVSGGNIGQQLLRLKGEPLSLHAAQPGHSIQYHWSDISTYAEPTRVMNALCDAALKPGAVNPLTRPLREYTDLVRNETFDPVMSANLIHNETRDTLGWIDQVGEGTGPAYLNYMRNRNPSVEEIASERLATFITNNKIKASERTESIGGRAYRDAHMRFTALLDEARTQAAEQGPALAFRHTDECTVARLGDDAQKLFDILEKRKAKLTAEAVR